MKLTEAIAELRSLYPDRHIGVDPRIVIDRGGAPMVEDVWLYISGADWGSVAHSGTFRTLESMVAKARAWAGKDRIAIESIDIDELEVANVA